MKRKSKGGTKHEQNYTILCEWCGDRRETSREDTLTCGSACRTKMSAYVRRFGYRPDEPVGKLPASAAIEIETIRLIEAEKRRRQAASAERTAYMRL